MRRLLLVIAATMLIGFGCRGTEVATPIVNGPPPPPEKVGPAVMPFTFPKDFRIMGGLTLVGASTPKDADETHDLAVLQFSTTAGPADIASFYAGVYPTPERMSSSGWACRTYALSDYRIACRRYVSGTPRNDYVELTFASVPSSDGKVYVNFTSSLEK